MSQFAQRRPANRVPVSIDEVIGAFAFAFVASLLAMDYIGWLHIPLIGY